MLCSRPESPPPRAPSPPLYAFTPLPSPSSRAVRKPSSSLSSAPTLPPGLQQDRSLLTVRSCELLSPRRSDFHRQPKRIRSAMDHISSSRTQSLSEPIIRPLASPPHQRTVSLTSRSSPPPSPQSQMPLPPVPQIPLCALTQADKSSTYSSDSLLGTTIYLPDIEPIPSITELPTSVLKPSKKGLGRTKAAGMTCLKFLTLRNSLKGSRPQELKGR